MFSFFRSRRKPLSARRQMPKHRFRVEALERRNLPTAIGVTLMAQTADANNVSVWGDVQFSDAPSVCSIVLSGQVSATLSSDSNGWFYYYGAASGLGTVTAQVTDSDGVEVEGSTDIMNSPPSFNGLDIEATGQGKQVAITGSISAGDVSGLTVMFSGSVGLANTVTTTDANGNFDVITTASSLGNLTATVTDVWGMQSSWSTSLTVMAPYINGLNAISLGAGVWEFQGSVSGLGADEDTIQFSGIVAGTTTVNANGSFSEELNLGLVNPSGTEFAVATDVWGQTSNQVSYTFAG